MGKLKNGLVQVRFLRSVGMYNKGEVACFTEEHLENLDPRIFTLDVDLEKEREEAEKNKSKKQKARDERSAEILANLQAAEEEKRKAAEKRSEKK